MMKPQPMKTTMSELLKEMLPALRTERFYKVCPLSTPVAVDLICFRTMAEVREERQLVVSLPAVKGMTLAQARDVRAALDQVIAHAEQLIQANIAKTGDQPGADQNGRSNP